MRRGLIRTITAVGTLATALAVPVVTAGSALALGPAIAYVSTVNPAGHHDSSCADPGYNDIQAAVDDVRAGGMVVVCRGVYNTSVTIAKRMTLQGIPGATIDATGQPYGIGVMSSYVTVTGMTVQNASGDNENFPYDGIVTAGLTDEGPVPADHVAILNNIVRNNQGNGIDLNSTSFSVAQGNISNGNSVGINVSDDLGKRAAYNTVMNNVTDYNTGGCGIALADHSGFGVVGNLISGNTSDYNGLSTPSAPDASAGSGIIMASPVPGGTVKNNVIQFNEFQGNGHGGVVVHSHVPNIPNGPTNDFTGNRIYGNVIGTNNLRQDTSDPETTGIYLGSASPLSITVASNVISNDHYGIFTAGAVTVVGANYFTNVVAQRGSVAAY